METLKQNSSITHLVLGGFIIHGDQAKEFMASLKENHTINYLDVTKTQIYLETLEEVSRSNTTITTFKYDPIQDCLRNPNFKKQNIDNEKIIAEFVEKNCILELRLSERVMQELNQTPLPAALSTVVQSYFCVLSEGAVQFLKDNWPRVQVLLKEEKSDQENKPSASPQPKPLSSEERGQNERS